MTKSIVLSSLKLFAVDFIGRILFWPIWWYTIGLKRLLTILAENIIEEEQRLGVGLWWKNLFTPMYGQYDWQGRIISFFMRLFVGIGRILLLLLLFSITFVALVVWVLVLPVAGYFLWRNLMLYYDFSWY